MTFFIGTVVPGLLLTIRTEIPFAAYLVVSLNRNFYSHFAKLRVPRPITNYLLINFSLSQVPRRIDEVGIRYLLVDL